MSLVQLSRALGKAKWLPWLDGKSVVRPLGRMEQVQGPLQPQVWKQDVHYCHSIQ